MLHLRYPLKNKKMWLQGFAADHKTKHVVKYVKNATKCKKNQIMWLTTTHFIHLWITQIFAADNALWLTIVTICKCPQFYPIERSDAKIWQDDCRDMLDFVPNKKCGWHCYKQENAADHEILTYQILNKLSAHFNLQDKCESAAYWILLSYLPFFQIFVHQKSSICGWHPIKTTPY